MTPQNEISLRCILDLHSDERIPPAAIEVYEYLNERAAALVALNNRRRAKTRAHVVQLEAKLTERREEFFQTVVLAVIASHDRRHVLAQLMNDTLYFPGASILAGETCGEGFVQILGAVGVVTGPPRELAVQQDQDSHGLKTNNVFMGGFQTKDSKKADMPRDVGWFSVGDTRFSATEKRLIQALMES